MKEKEFPLVSVIIPNYCHSKYLAQRIDSVLNQTYQNFELIILDDRSPDNGASKAVIEKYRDNPHVSEIIYNTENSGSTFKQWNKGISLAKGEYIWIAESDDYCELDILEKLVNQIQKHDTCSLVYCLSQQVDSNGSIIGKQIRMYKNRFLRGNEFIRKYMCCENPVYNASAAIFKKEAALRIDKGYMAYKGAGDRLFWIEIAEQGDVAIVNNPLNYFRQHNQKVTPKRTLDGTNLREAFDIYQYLKKNGYLSVIRSCLVKGFYLHLIYKTKFESELIRENLFLIWNGGADPLKIRMFLGRFFVSLRYKFHLYL